MKKSRFTDEQIVAALRDGSDVERVNYDKTLESLALITLGGDDMVDGTKQNDPAVFFVHWRATDTA